MLFLFFGIGGGSPGISVRLFFEKLPFACEE
jgi:hypothetical protein